jgi:hypothetical protein
VKLPVATSHASGRPRKTGRKKRELRLQPLRRERQACAVKEPLFCLANTTRRSSATQRRLATYMIASITRCQWPPSPPNQGRQAGRHSINQSKRGSERTARVARSSHTTTALWIEAVPHEELALPLLRRVCSCSCSCGRVCVAPKQLPGSWRPLRLVILQYVYCFLHA